MLRDRATTAGLATLAICLVIAAVFVVPKSSDPTVELSEKHSALSQSKNRLKQKLAMTSSVQSKLSEAVEKAGAAPTTGERKDMMNNLNLIAGLLASQVSGTSFSNEFQSYAHITTKHIRTRTCQLP
jgi:hypothetical protein